MSFADSGDGESEAASVRRRRLKFRCWHRGMKEVDLLLGPFADARVDGFGAERLAEFEALLNLPDPDILAWVMGEAAVPAEHDTPLMRLLLAHYR